MPPGTWRRALVLLVLLVVRLVLVGGTFAAAAPGDPTTADRPPAPLAMSTVQTCPPGSPLSVCAPGPSSATPTSRVPLPILIGPATAVSCFPGEPQSECRTPSIAASPVEPTGVPPCTGPGCIPQPTTSAPAPTDPGTGQPTQGADSGQGDCGIEDVGGCVLNAIDGFFRGVVEDALNPLLDLLSTTLLNTPTLDSVPRIAELWNNSWQILLASYALLILLAGIVVMSYETVQTRYGFKEIAPRIVVGFLAGALSLWVATQAIDIANALAQAVMGGGLDANSAGDTLRNLLLGPLLNTLDGGTFLTFLGLFLVGMLVVLLVSYVVRVALTLILIAGAPIALMAHALPQTEGIAYWWWKAFGACLAIQIVQSLTLVTMLRVFLAPGGFLVFGATMSGLVNLLVALALFYILFKIPFWCLGSLRRGGRRSLLGSLVRGFVAYKTFGLLRGRGGGGIPRTPSGHTPPDDPFATTRATRSGQYMLPLNVARRPRPSHRPVETTPNHHARRSGQAEQSTLPLDGQWPENKPALGRDGQYRLPFGVKRVPRPAPPPPPKQGRPPTPNRQTKLPLDGQWPENKPTLGRDGQYQLPLNVPRQPATRRQPQPPPPPNTRRSRSRQLPLPLDLPKIRRPRPRRGGR